LLLGVGLLALLGVAGWLLLAIVSRPGSGITRANYERIQKGMTEGEVETVFGCPAADYSGKTPELLMWTKELRESLNRHAKANQWSLQQILKGCEEGKLHGWDQEDLKRRLKEAEPDAKDMVAKIWIGDSMAALVVFQEGRVTFYLDEVFESASWIDRLRRLLPW
jgi:hypothetical protein